MILNFLSDGERRQCPYCNQGRSMYHSRDVIRNPDSEYHPPFEQPCSMNGDSNKINFILCVSDDDEKEIMVCMFEFAKDLINLQLTETELALICAVVLIDHCECKSTIKLH